MKELGILEARSVCITKNSNDHDLEQIYLDSFLTTAKLEGQDVTNALEQLSAVGEKFNVKFVVSMSLDKEEVPASLQDKIITAL